MKFKNTIFAAAFCCSILSTAQAAVSLSLSSVTGATTGALTNLQSSTGVNNVQRVWGILVDADQNGVFLGQYLFGASLLGNAATTLQIDVGGVATNTDDRLYIAPNLMANSATTIDGGTASGLARPISFSNIQTPNLVSNGDPFYVVWFDEVALGGSTVEGGNYGAFRINQFTIGPDGSTTPYQANFVGVDPARPANLKWIAAVPETSTSLLGAIGALALLRRRRN